MNILNQRGDELIPTDYSRLLTAIEQALQQSRSPLFVSARNQRGLIIEVGNVAEQVAKLPAAVQTNPLGGNAYQAQVATVHFSAAFRAKFPDHIHRLQQLIRQQLAEFVAQRLPDNNTTTTLRQYLAGLVKPLSSFAGKGQQLGLEYPFDYPITGLEKQRLRMQSDPPVSDSPSQAIRPVLNLHKLTLTVKTAGFDTQIFTGLATYLRTHLAPTASPDDLEDLNDLLDSLHKESGSEMERLRQLVDSEALGKLKKAAKLAYLDFLLTNSGSNNTRHEGQVYLTDLLRRVRFLETYLGRADLPDSHFEVSYGGKVVNYRDLFARAEAYDDLPIIPLLVGYLGETTDDAGEERQFSFGLKLKLDGLVHSQAHGEKALSVFNYKLAMLDLRKFNSSEEDSDSASTPRQPSLPAFYLEKVLRIALLYYVVFHKFGDLSYNPAPDLEEKLLRPLQESNDTQKQACLLMVKEQLQAEAISPKLTRLKGLLKNILRRTPALPSHEYHLHLSLSWGILLTDHASILKQGSFFQPALRDNPRQMLKYLSVGQPHPDPNSLVKLEARVEIANPQFYPTDDRQQFTLRYAVGKWHVLPVLMLPRNDPGSRQVYRQHFERYGLVILPYDHQFLTTLQAPSEYSLVAFRYRFTYLLLAYLCLQVLVEEAGQGDLFVPLVRLHLQGKLAATPEDSFIRSLAKVLSHLLSDSETCQANSQGFDISALTSNPKPAQPANLDYYKIRNGLSSLYSGLPKLFEFANPAHVPSLAKLAVIVVSSRKSDLKRNGTYHLSTLLGEVITLERRGPKVVQVQTRRTFAANYNSQTLFREPTVLLDQVSQLYAQGYRHFIYVARSPYSSSLHLTRPSPKDNADEAERELYFLSRSIIRALNAGKPDLKLYPVFFDKYYVVRLEKLASNALYIQDTLELSQLIEDPARQAVVFFNLFNGITVSSPGDSSEKYYNGVISYATLLNVYRHILDEQDLRQALLSQDDTPGALKSNLLQYLTLLHFSRYQAAFRLSFKLDPYQGIVGDDSVGALAIFPGASSGVSFNALAFLVEVRRALKATPSA
jgi:hypothetical protein